VSDCLLLSISWNPAILASLALACGLYFLFAGLRPLTRSRSFATVPGSNVQSAPIGLVEVHGVAAGPNTIPAPVTGKPCFLYRATVWQRATETTAWLKVADEILHVPFYIDDLTGKLLIEPLGADLDLRQDFCEQYSFIGSSSRDVPPRVSVFLSRHGLVATPQLRVEERLIAPGDSLFIVGTVCENPGIQVRPLRSLHQGSRGTDIVDDDSDSYANDHQSPEIIRLSTSTATATNEMTQQQRIAAALTRAGITRPEAWSAAGVPYQTQTIEQTTAPPATESEHDAAGFDLAPPVVMMQGGDDPFVISFRSHKESGPAFGTKSAIMLLAGAAMTVLGIYRLLTQFKLF